MLTSLTQAELKGRLHYDPNTGRFTWVGSTARWNGSEAGSVNSKGYLVISIDGVGYRAHRLAYLYMKGEWPLDQIDHRDLNKLNNKWLNLRPADNSQNNTNRPAQADSDSGYRGVYWDTSKHRWRAEITIRGKRIRLGRFKDLGEAAEAYAKASRVYHGQYSLTEC